VQPADRVADRLVGVVLFDGHPASADTDAIDDSVLRARRRRHG
jgi:hypothetical protein